MKFFLILLAITSQSVFACSDFKWEWQTEDWVTKPDEIHHGMVVAVSLSDETINDGDTNPLINAISLRDKKNIKFKVFDTLKGKSVKVITATMLRCAGGVAEFGDEALLFKIDGIWHIKSLDGRWGDGQANEILLKIPNHKHEWPAQL